MWNYKIVSRENKVIGEASNYWVFDDTLDGLNGSFYVSAAEETAPEIYKHGFIKEDGKHFSYNDGTPFFYLGDTHWTMLLEPIAMLLTETVFGSTVYSKVLVSAASE